MKACKSSGKNRFRKGGMSRILAVLGMPALIATMLVPFHVSAAGFGGVYEGWKHISQDNSDPQSAPEYVSYNKRTRALTLNALDSDGEMLYLNREDSDGENSGADNITKFGKAAMSKFTVEFDALITDAPGGSDGQFEFVFLSEEKYNFGAGGITAGFLDWHTALWWRGTNGGVAPAGSATDYFDQWGTIYDNGVSKTAQLLPYTQLSGKGLQHVTVTKDGRNISVTVDGSGTLTAVLPDDIGLPESGYIGFMAARANVTLSNVKVTNGTTDAEQTFFDTGGATDFGAVYEGWKHISKDAGDPEPPAEYISCDETTRALTFNALDSDGEMLYLNREDGDGENSSGDNIAKFGKAAMSKYTVEFDALITDAPGGSGGQFEFVFLSEEKYNFGAGGITAGLLDWHTALWWRGTNGGVAPAGSATDYFDQWGTIYDNGASKTAQLLPYTQLSGKGIQHVTVTKDGRNISVTVDGSGTLTAVLPDDIGLSESGYIGFFTARANVTLSNVKVTNGTTNAEQIFFGAAAGGSTVFGELYEDWRHISGDKSDPKAPAEYVSYDETTRALTFNALDSDGEMLYLNREAGDGHDSGSSNLSKFGKDAMSDFTVEYDLALTETRPGADGGGQIAFAFMGADHDGLPKGSITAGHTNDHNCFWWRGYAGITMPEEYSWGVVGYPQFLDPSVCGDGQTHRVKVVKDGWDISMSMDDGVPVTVTLPDDIGLPPSGYIGFFAEYANAVISNVKVTNDTTDASETFFGDGSGPVIPPKKTVDELEGWSAFCNQQTETASHFYQRDGSGALFFDGMYCGADFIYLNSDYGTSAAALDNAAKFGKDAMGDYTVDFDFSLRDLHSDAGGALNFVLGAEHKENPGIASTVLQMNGSATAFKYEYHALENYGLLPDTHPENVLVGNETHHVTVQKKGGNVSITIDGYAAWDNYTLPDTIKSGNSEPDRATPDSGYLAFWFRNARGYIANVKVTNDATNVSKTFFADYGGSLDYWEMGGGDTTNLLAVTPEKGTGVRGESTGESPDNTTLKYVLPLDLKTLTFDFIPKTVTSSDIDRDAWMGFALMKNGKDYNPDNPEKNAGFVAEIQSKDNGAALITFKSLLPGEAYGAHTATYEMADFRAGQTYTFGAKYTSAGLEVSLNGKKIAALGRLGGLYNGGLGYLTTTASATDGFAQAWVVAKLNGENAVDYDSGLIDDSGEDGGYDGDDGGKPDTGSNGVYGALWILLAAPMAATAAVKAKKSRRA